MASRPDSSPGDPCIAGVRLRRRGLDFSHPSCCWTPLVDVIAPMMQNIVLQIPEGARSGQVTPPPGWAFVQLVGVATTEPRPFNVFIDDGQNSYPELVVGYYLLVYGQPVPGPIRPRIAQGAINNVWITFDPELPRQSPGAPTRGIDLTLQFT